MAQVGHWNAELRSQIAYDQLHHFVGAGVWDAAHWRQNCSSADKLVGGRDAVVVIDDTAVPKNRKHTVGVAPILPAIAEKVSR